MPTDVLGGLVVTMVILRCWLTGPQRCRVLVGLLKGPLFLCQSEVGCLHQLEEPQDLHQRGEAWQSYGTACILEDLAANKGTEWTQAY